MLTTADMIAGLLASSSEWHNPSQSYEEALRPFSEDFGLFELALDVVTVFALFTGKDLSNALTNASLPLILKMVYLIIRDGMLEKDKKPEEELNSSVSQKAF